jgi:hypothetical protein
MTALLLRPPGKNPAAWPIIVVTVQERRRVAQCRVFVVRASSLQQYLKKSGQTTSISLAGLDS